MKKVLIVEDEAALQQLWKREVERYGLEREITLLQAYTISEAKTMLDQHKDLHLVVLDEEVVKGNSGLALLKKLRSTYSYVGPVLSISSSSSMRALTVQEGIRLGHQMDHCEKKFILHHVLNILSISIR